MTVLLNALLLLVSVFAASTAVIMIKASTVHPFLLASLRLFVAAAALMPIYLRDLRRHRAAYTGAHLRASMLPGVILAIHLMSWVVGARMTPTANASLIVNLMPLAMPFFLAWLVGERLTGREIAATGIALVGVIILGLIGNILNLQSFISPYLNGAFQGVIIILAVLLQRGGRST